ncbi:ABC transporter permease [Clostridium gelidum]|uniref:ABC transporter permease n=1 Tax=Clostridium gelidum TaxID=704125 RepID=A0ABM7SZE3_9CLOT|nr:FtsX-like permease family protein [Clostridium gelidum]BCZ45018.1 ABC transporter permease [Clostridium gelidum]
MTSYLALAPKYLSVHKRKTRLASLSIVIAVTLVVSIFSMLESLIKFETAQVLKNEGNYHILIFNPSENETAYVDNRIDVKNAGTLKDLGEGTINNEKCAFGSLDEKFANNLNFNLAQGTYPTKENEIMLEKWFMEKVKINIGSAVSVAMPNNSIKEFTVSGVYNDWGGTKAASIPIVFLSVNMSNTLTPKLSQHFILFKDGVNIKQTEDIIKKDLKLTDDRVAHNEGLLALMMQTNNNTIIKFYAIGGVLFCLVLVTAITMIYNTFNISVMERVRQFGVLRCIGASKKQIERLVRREGIVISLKAIPIGIITGMIISSICSVILKYYNTQIFGEISIFNFSIVGISLGVIIGFLTVFIASLIPAQKASNVSPVNAVTGSNEIKISKKKKKGFLTKVFNIDISLGINNAVTKKKTLFLMSVSIALSIMLFMGFNILVNPKALGMTPIKSYTPDISLTSKQGISNDMYSKLSSIDGIKRVYGRMTNYVTASFDAEKLTDEYTKNVGEIKIDNKGLFVAAENNSWLMSYDKTQLNWAKEFLTAGELDEDKLNSQNGIIVVEKSIRGNDLVKNTKLKIGDKIYIKTTKGNKEFTVVGILSSAPQHSESVTMSTFITTEKLFSETFENNKYSTIEMQLNDKKQNVANIQAMEDSNIKFHDMRQLNSEAQNAFMTIAVFIYGFVGVIVLISILNIINTMNTSVESKTKYLGVMRAIGMSGDQLFRMVLTEAFVYSLSGCTLGCTLGLVLQRTLGNLILGEWKFPLLQIVFIFACYISITILSVINPLKRIRANSISQVVTAM